MDRSDFVHCNFGIGNFNQLTVSETRAELVYNRFQFTAVSSIHRPHSVKHYYLAYSGGSLRMNFMVVLTRNWIRSFTKKSIDIISINVIVNQYGPLE
jgi:hypothetical protein